VEGRPGTEPLSLRQLLDSVGGHHPLLAAASANVRAATGARMNAGGLGNPMLAVQIENTAFPGGQTPAGLGQETFATATLPLEPLYLRGARVRAADASVDGAEASGRGVRRRLASGAIQAFYRTAIGQVDVEIAREVARWLDTLVAANTARVRDGFSAEADLFRSRIERARATAQAGTAEAELAFARGELAQFLGARGPNSPALFAVMVRTDSIDAIGGGLPAAPEDFAADSALQLRPDVVVARAMVRQREAATNLEKWLIFPQVSATFGAKWMAGTSSMIAGFSLPIPLLGLNRGNIRRATAEGLVAREELLAIEQAARGEILASHAAALAWSGRVRELPLDLLAVADELRRIALEAYREGAIPLLQVIDAIRAWGAASHDYYQITFAYRQSHYELMLATGTDLLPDSPAASRGGEETRP
jgi:cobalt-zinc-cadmium efflux system outer membrane protein